MPPRVFGPLDQNPAGQKHKQTNNITPCIVSLGYLCIHLRISVYIVDKYRSASKSTPLNSHLVLNSLMYFRSISTASNVYDHLLCLFVADSDGKDAFRFSCDFFGLSVASPLPHLSESSGFPSCSRRQLPGSWSSRSFREMSPLLSSDCSELCSDDLATTKRRKYSPGLCVREAILKEFRGDLTVIRSHKSWPF